MVIAVENCDGCEHLQEVMANVGSEKFRSTLRRPDCRARFSKDYSTPRKPDGYVLSAVSNCTHCASSTIDNTSQIQKADHPPSPRETPAFASRLAGHLFLLYFSFTSNFRAPTSSSVVLQSWNGSGPAPANELRGADALQVKFSL